MSDATTKRSIRVEGDTPMMTEAEIRALLDGTMPGPWRWEVSLASKIVKLCGGNPHKGFGKYDLTVMEFVRWGMSRAAPVFWGGSLNGRDDPRRADVLAVPVAGREHHERWFRDIDHPDARIMAAAPNLARTALALHQQLADAEAAQAAFAERAATPLQFMVDSIAEDKAYVAEKYPILFALIQARRAEKGTLGGVQVFGEIARDLLKLLSAPDTGVKALAELRTELLDMTTDRDSWKGEADHWMEKADEGRTERDAALAEITALRANEKELSDAYLRIRAKLQAWDTKPGGVDRFEVTEAALDAALARVAELEGQVGALLKLRKSIEADVRSAHQSRGNGASEWMRDDDREFRRDLSTTLDALESALSPAGEAGQ